MSEETYEYDKAYFTQKIQKILADINKDTSVVFNEEECENVPTGTTKLGGLPDLPPCAEYPVREGYTTEKGDSFPPLKLPLICQINCEELAPFLWTGSSIPKTGMIYIFWDGEDPGYYVKKYGVNTLRAFYWDGDASTLVRRGADENTQLRPERKVTFSQFNEVYAEDIDWRVENLLEDLKDVCEECGIDYCDTEEYDTLDSLADCCIVSDATKLFGFRAGHVYQGAAFYNCFLQLNEHIGALWYAFINVHFDENMAGWTEIRSSVDYDAD